MAAPHPVELFIPMLAFGTFGFLLLGPFGAGIGVVAGAALGSVASIADEE